jgi:ubiquitin-protein ligase
MAHEPTTFVITAAWLQDNYVANGASRPNPYAGRSFTVSVKYPATYPFKHPEPKFKAGSLFHPNVNKYVKASPSRLSNFTRPLSLFFSVHVPRALTWLHAHICRETGEVCGELFADWGPTKNSTDVAKTIVKFLGEPNLCTFPLHSLSR